jgi:hypothetical protein
MDTTKVSMVLAAALLLAGCGNTADGPAAQARTEIAALPSLEDTKTQLTGAVDQIVTAVKAVLPKAVWDDGGNETTTSCNSSYADTDGKMWFAPNRVVPEVPLRPEKWDTIAAAAREAAGRIGATEVQVERDLPTNRNVWFRGPAGMAIQLAYQGNLVIAGTTGCRLPA